MSLRKPPIQTPAFLAAHRKNALKCTGPRTVAGKARSSLNALKDGRHARGLLGRLRTAGLAGQAELYLSIQRDVEDALEPPCTSYRNQLERFTTAVYALARKAEGVRTKLECPLFSARLGPRSYSLFRFGITDPRGRVGLVFWVQRKGYWNYAQLMWAMLGKTGRKREPPLGRLLESRLRHRVYRMHRAGACEQAAYGLDAYERMSSARKPQRCVQRWLQGFRGRWWEAKSAAASWAAKSGPGHAGRCNRKRAMATRPGARL